MKEIIGNQQPNDGLFLLAMSLAGFVEAKTGN